MFGWSTNWRSRAIAAGVVLAVFATAAAPRVATAEAVSEPAILQMFEARWDTIEDRMADIFEVGYGQMWLPPPQRADSGSYSVGYDVFDRFDLGSPRNETLYGTETSLKSSICGGLTMRASRCTPISSRTTTVSGISNTTEFRRRKGGYPGFVLSTAG